MMAITMIDDKHNTGFEGPLVLPLWRRHLTGAGMRRRWRSECLIVLLWVRLLGRIWACLLHDEFNDLADINVLRHASFLTNASLTTSGIIVRRRAGSNRARKPSASAKLMKPSGISPR